MGKNGSFSTEFQLINVERVMYIENLHLAKITLTIVASKNH
jgi:hypothetical protein